MEFFGDEKWSFENKYTDKALQNTILEIEQEITFRKIGYKMLDLSKQCQIFCITHSAQIASLADIHYLISKSTVGSETETKIKTLDYNGRVNELSRILGGINVTDSQRAAAVDMLNNRDGN